MTGSQYGCEGGTDASYESCLKRSPSSRQPLMESHTHFDLNSLQVLSTSRVGRLTRRKTQMAL
jgi:hypothetical protein